MVDLNKKIQMCMLADFYGNLLTEKQRMIFRNYWEQDCSLFEISEELGITRQAVHDSLNKAELILLDVEDKCGFVKKYHENKQLLKELYDNLDLSNKQQAIIADKVANIINKL